MINILFYFFSILLLLSNLLVVISNNPIISLLFLVLGFVISTLMLLLLECEFLALILLIIYVGAVAILFLFVLMMLEIKLRNLNKNIFLHFPFGVFINSIFFLLLLDNIFKNYHYNPYCCNNLLHGRSTFISWYRNNSYSTDIEIFGYILYTNYVLQFLIIGFILFLALISIVFLSHNPIKKHKNQTAFYQLSRNSIIF